MLLTGRRLASNEPFSLWEETTGETLLLQDRARQTTLTLTLAEAEALRDVLVQGLTELAQPERRKDALRRFQILRARLTTAADRARQLPADGDEGDA